MTFLSFLTVIIAPSMFLGNFIGFYGGSIDLAWVLYEVLLALYGVDIDDS